MSTLLYDTWTILWREMQRYKRSKSGVLIRLVQPAVWIIVIGHTFSGTQPLLQSVGFDGQYIEFMTPGVLILTAIFTSIFGGVNTLWDRRYGFMNKALTYPISRSAIALGKMSAITLIAAMQAFMILGMALIIGVRLPDPVIMIAPIMGIVVLLSLGFSAISVAVAAVVKSHEVFWGAINFLGIPLFMLSPALFPLALLPDWLAAVTKLNPVTYAVLLVREMMTGVPETITGGGSSSSGNIPFLLSLGIIIVFVLVTTGLATYAFTREVSRPF